MMSFMPAGEEDDYDSEDGFIGDEPFILDHAGQENNMIPNNDQERLPNSQRGKSGNQTDTRFSPSGHHGSNGLAGKSMTSKNGSTTRMMAPLSVLTEEDFKLAAIRGNVLLAENCLNQGIPVNQHLRSGWTALMYASNYARPEMIKFLLSKGADVRQHQELYTPLMCACSSSVNSKDKIHSCIKLLVEAGSDVNSSDRYHSTPLMLASKGGHLEIVKYLLQHGVAVNSQDHRGWTALTWAIQGSHKDIVVALLDAGADSDLEHTDKLTAKDFAAHLPTDEILALLEHRPVNRSRPTWEGHHSSYKMSNVSNNASSDGDEYTRSSDQHYGDLEVFLLGLDLPHVTHLFRQQLIDLDLLLTLTEEDLVKAGVEQLGARKKILDAAQAVHKKDWDPSSLVSAHFNKAISCSDAVAMVANASKHVRYIGSTVIYIKEQLHRHPAILSQCTDQVTSLQFLQHVEDTMRNVVQLRTHLARLHSQTKEEMGKRSLEPPDLIKCKVKRKFNIGIIKKVCGLVLAAMSVWLVRKYVLRDTGSFFTKYDPHFLWRKSSLIS